MTTKNHRTYWRFANDDRDIGDAAITIIRFGDAAMATIWFANDFYNDRPENAMRSPTMESSESMGRVATRSTSTTSYS